MHTGHISEIRVCQLFCPPCVGFSEIEMQANVAGIASSSFCITKLPHNSLYCDLLIPPFAMAPFTCDVCLDLSSDKLEDYPSSLDQGYAILRKVEAFHDSALNGCDSCSLLLDGIDCFIPNRESIDDIAIFRHNSLADNRPLYLRIYMIDSVAECIEFYVELRI